MTRKARAMVEIAVLLCAASFAGACAGDGSTGTPDGAERWSAVQDLRVGSMDDPRYALTWFREVLVGPTGRMFTLHPQEQLIRVFDAKGELERTIGGRGDGPTEFQNLIRMGWVGDRLWALDADGYAFKLFSTEGELLETFSVPFVMEPNPDGTSPARASGLLWDGTVHGAPPAWSSQIASGELTHHVPLLLTREGTVTDTLPAIAFGNNSWAVYDPDKPNSGGSYGPQPFADGPLWSYVEGERAMLHLDREAPEVAEGATFSLTKLTFSGDTVWARDYPYTAQAIRPAEVDSVLDARAVPLGESGFLGLTVARARDWAGRTLYAPPFKSHVKSMVMGRDGSIWLETLEPAPSPGSTEWIVLDPEGHPRARVFLPTGLNLMAADAEHVWGSMNDELDVPYLVRYVIDHDERAPSTAP